MLRLIGNGRPLHAIVVLGLGKVGALAAEPLSENRFAATGYDLAGSGVASHGCSLQPLDLIDAAAADAARIHYFDLTEDMLTTAAIRKLAQTSPGLTAPQCGLTPGLAGIVGANLIDAFDICRSCRMRVGDLSQNPTGLMGYSFNWLPDGVVYDCGGMEEWAHK